MKILKVFGWIVALLVFLVIVVPLFLPSSYRIERSIEINAPVKLVYNTALDFDLRCDWDPWLEQEPDAQTEMIGNSGEIGSGYSWEGDTLGSGQLIIQEVKPNETINSKLEFFSPRSGEATVIWNFKSSESITEAFWILEGDLKYPVERFMGPFFDKIMGPDLARGLENFKTLCEKMDQMTEQPRTGEVMEKDVQARILVTMIRETNIENVAEVLGELYSKIMGYIEENNVTIAGAPLATYLEFTEETGDITLEAGVPVSEKIDSRDDILVKELPEMHAVTAIHFGPYETISVTYDALGNYIEDNGKEITGTPWEEYLTDPTTVSNPYLIKTIVCFPVK